MADDLTYILGKVRQKKLEIPVFRGEINFVRWDNPVLSLAGEMVPVSLLHDEHGVSHPFAWDYFGQIRVIPATVVESLFSVYRDQERLIHLGRFAQVDLKVLQFTWDQTVSLEEYFHQLGKLLKGQTEGDSGD